MLIAMSRLLIQTEALTGRFNVKDSDGEIDTQRTDEREWGSPLLIVVAVRLIPMESPPVVAEWPSTLGSNLAPGRGSRVCFPPPPEPP